MLLTRYGTYMIITSPASGVDDEYYIQSAETEVYRINGVEGTEERYAKVIYDHQEIQKILEETGNPELIDIYETYTFNDARAYQRAYQRAERAKLKGHWYAIFDVEKCSPIFQGKAEKFEDLPEYARTAFQEALRTKNDMNRRVVADHHAEAKLKDDAHGEWWAGETINLWMSGDV